jgi:hypothetical protein
MWRAEIVGLKSLRAYFCVLLLNAFRFDARPGGVLCLNSASQTVNADVAKPKFPVRNATYSALAAHRLLDLDWFFNQRACYRIVASIAAGNSQIERMAILPLHNQK